MGIEIVVHDHAKLNHLVSVLDKNRDGFDPDVIIGEFAETADGAG